MRPTWRHRLAPCHAPCHASHAVTTGAHADVEYAVKDTILWAAVTPDDPSYRFQWGLPRVGAPAAWDFATGAPTKAGAATVCITDSGLDATQPDLVGNLHPLVGYSALSKDGNVTDGLQHGTHVAGIVGATGNNSLMVSGVNWDNVSRPILPMRRPAFNAGAPWKRAGRVSKRGSCIDGAPA